MKQFVYKNRNLEMNNMNMEHGTASVQWIYSACCVILT